MQLQIHTTAVFYHFSYLASTKVSSYNKSAEKSFISVNYSALRMACHVFESRDVGDDLWVTSKKNMGTRFLIKIEVTVTYKVNGSWICNLAIHVLREWSEIISELIQLEYEIKLQNIILKTTCAALC